VDTKEKGILTDPYAIFVYAIKSQLTRKKYEARLAKFFYFSNIPGKTLAAQCSSFEQKARY
jgi:hypothetical protein